MKIKNLLKFTLLPLSGVAASLLFLVSVLLFSLWYQNTYKTEIQTIKIPEHNVKFILLTNISGFGDRAWYVYKISINEHLTSTQKKSGETDGILFWNYSESGEHQENPNIRFIKNRYLIFSRGNIDYSLYDLALDKVLVNKHSAWGTAVAKPDIDLPINELNQLMTEWAYENLHRKINEYVKQL